MADRTFRRALVICNGEPPSRMLLREAARQSDLIVAADGGANSAVALGVRPDIVIGDLDSIKPATRRVLRAALILRVDRQDNTDLEKALDFLAFRGVRRIVIVGATGRRIDFTLGNLSVLWNYARSMDITVAGDGWRATPVVRSLSVRAPKGTVVSIIPFGVCDGITLKGFVYPLRNASMRVGEIGVSNVVASSPARIQVRRGHLLAVVFSLPALPGGRLP